MSIAAERQNLIAAPLWRRARDMLSRAFATLGGPGSIAAIAKLTGPLRRRIVGWLCPLEHVVRKLLLAEAAAFHRLECAAAVRAAAGPRLIQIPLRGVALHADAQPANAVSPPRAPAVGDVAGRSSPDLSHPESWSARFSFALPRDPLAVTDARAPRIRALWGPASQPTPIQAAPRAHASGLGLARRFEALRRVLENPLPHARRLARLLLRLTRRFPEAIRRYAVAPARVNDFDPDDPRLGVEACAAGFGGAGALADTS